MLHIYSFDPGQTTGWCHLSIHGNEIGHFTCGEGDHISIGNMLYDNPALISAAKKNGNEIELIFVCESYIQRNVKSPAPWSLETIGLIRYWAAHYGIELVMQQPSEAKSLVTNDVIKRAELWVPGKRHADDAIRHCLYYLIKNRRLMTECLLKQN